MDVDKEVTVVGIAYSLKVSKGLKCLVVTREKSTESVLRNEQKRLVNKEKVMV